MNYMTDPSLTEEEKMRMAQMAQAQAIRAQQQPQQQGGMNPMQAYRMYNQFAGGSTAGGAGGGASGAASGGASGGASSGGGMMASAGPWAALAAAIAINESVANDQGRRPDDFGDHMTDLASGKVLEYDADALAESDFMQKIPGGEELTKLGGKLGNPEGLYEVGETGIKNLGKGFKKLWEWF